MMRKAEEESTVKQGNRNDCGKPLQNGTIVACVIIWLPVITRTCGKRATGNCYENRGVILYHGIQNAVFAVIPLLVYSASQTGLTNQGCGIGQAMINSAE